MVYCRRFGQGQLCRGTCSIDLEELWTAYIGSYQKLFRNPGKHLILAVQFPDNKNSYQPV